MHSLWLECTGADRELLIADLYDLATLGITEHDSGLQAFFELPFATDRFSQYRPRWVEEPSRDWVCYARSMWEPRPVGERLFLVPDWLNDPAPPGRLRLTVHAGMASGTGYSEPTRLALEALERHVRPGDTLLDAGAGSGILTAAARLLGAGSLYACEIDVQACMETRRNFALDGVPAALWIGSPRSLRSSTVDCLIANLNAVTLLNLAGELRRVSRPGASLILSGFRDRRLNDVEASLQPARRIELRESGCWRCLVLSRG
jgi:ribosomal protein L11 methyltransferase